MGLEWLADPTAWLGLATLILLEIVLGIDNLVFIAILADKLPPAQRERARVIGLALALIMRLGLLVVASWIITLTEPLITLFGSAISGRDIILIAGGAFLLFKATAELHERLEGASAHGKGAPAHAIFWQVIVQIIVLDAVFSLDSIITAVAMVPHLSLMMIAVVIAVGVMMLSSRVLMSFISRHPTVVILCLGFLLMIGFSLLVEGFGFHIPKAYLYAAIAFSVMIEAFNQIGRWNVARRVTMMDRRENTARAVLRLLGGRASDAETAESVAALANTPSHEVIFAPEERTMIERVLRLGERSVRSIMVPRPDVCWLNINDPSDTVLDKVRDSAHSRYIVSRTAVDDVVGIVHTKDLLEQARRTGSIDLQTGMRTPLYVNEGMPALKLLDMFRTSNTHMAVVLDEYGTMEGIATPVDILKAIAGEMPDTDGIPQPDAVEQDDGSWLLDGGTPIEEAERILDTSSMTEDADCATLAGFMLHRFDHIPEPGESFSWNGRTFKVAALEGRRIAQVLVTHIHKQD